MSRKSRRQRKRRANRRNKAQLGTQQLQESRRAAASPEDSTDATQPDSSGRPVGGEERGDPTHQEAEEAVRQGVPDVETDIASGETEGHWGNWPYRVVGSDDDFLELSWWLQVLGNAVEKSPVGISATDDKLAFATKEQGWLVRWGYWESPFVWPEVLGKVLTTERVAPVLVTRDTNALVEAMGHWIGRDASNLLPNIVHDMAALEYTTGRSIARDLSPLKDALDCAAVGPALAVEAPKFYHKVAMPLVRHNAGPQVIEDIDSKSRWTITYDYLLLRVLTHFTKDPTMIRGFNESKNPLETFSNYLEIDSNHAIAFLLWMVCGEDVALMARYYPEWVNSMPESPKLIKALHVEKKLPNLQIGLIRLLEEYTTSRRAETLYGRHSPWGLRPEELLHFSIMGSVCDLLDVLVATLLLPQYGSKNHWLISAKDKGYPHWLRAQVVGYNGEEPMDWQRKLEALSHLNDPLGQVPLDGKVSVD